jgi:hypothetical protein
MTKEEAEALKPYEFIDKQGNGTIVYRIKSVYTEDGSDYVNLSIRSRRSMPTSIEFKVLLFKFEKEYIINPETHFS